MQGVDVCDSAPRIVTLQTYRGTESAERTQFIKTETLTIKFRSDTPGIEPAVRIRSGTSEYAAARQGTSTNPYEFRLALAEVPAGPAQVIVAGIKDDSCIGSRLADITVQETAAELFGTEPSSLRLTSSAFTEASGGKKKATVTATFLDAAGNPVSFAAAMAFEVMEGVAMISPPTCSTTSAQSSCASSAGIVKSTVPGSGTWGYKASGTLNACEWRCDDTHIKEGNSCVPKTITTGADCTNIPQFSEICPGDNANSPSILVDACTEATKCEYMCVAGRKREGSTCVLPQAGTSTPGRPVSLRAVSNPTSIETGGGSRTSEITATFLNNAGNLLPFSGTITFTTNLGNLIQTSCTTTSEQSSCGVMLQSADTAGIAKVTATWGNISNNANVIFTSPATDTTPPNVLNPQPQETVTALPMTLYVQTDESARCRYSRTPGTAYGSMQSTTPLGRAHQWTLDGLTNGIQRFYIRCEDEAGNAAQQDFQHSFLLDVPGNQQVTLLRISPSNPSIQANGVSTSAITARFTNNAGETLATARTIDFTTTAGTLLQNSCSTTTSETTCSVTLRSSTTPGIASVRGVSGSLSDETGVQFTEQAQPSCTGTPPANSDICSGDNTGLSTDTPITLVSSCGTPKCEYACRTGFTKQGSTCVPQTFSCTGTAPSNSELCFNDNTGLTINTSVTLVGACGSAKCEYTCASGYTKQGSICEPSSPFICTGQIPPNSDLCLNDNTGLSVSTPITLTDSCGAPKCEYRCASGFVKQGTACVAAPISVCTGTPPSSSEQCQGDSTGLTQNTQITLVNSCGTPKCEYVCGSGYTKQGNQCEPLSPYVCLGQVPSNAELCLNDNTGLTQNTQITIANSCTAA
ncbi:MAG: hypothetical protein HYT73_02405, partial [Candidatus Aenigmarchaeota archaeon]|nr:hypothetical protein [Candidatus Aenigmarchaeota archaeon]